MKFLQFIKSLFLKQEESTKSSYDIYEQSYNAYKYTFDINGADYTTYLLKTSYVYNSSITASHIDTYPPVVKNHWGERTIHIKTQLLLVVLHKLNIRPPL